MKYTKILCLDFDGVIHSYSSGWCGARTIPDPPVPGAIEFIQRFMNDNCRMTNDPLNARSLYPKVWELHIFSSRSHYLFGIRAMKKWLLLHGLKKHYLKNIKFPKHKPPAVVTLDDRAITFTGMFPTYETIQTFQPWNKKNK